MHDPTPADSLHIQILPDAGCEDLVPTYASSGAAGVDLKAARDFVVAPGECQIIAVGFRIAVPHGWEMQIRSRSGLAFKHGIAVAQGVGTVDSDYRGPVAVLLRCSGEHPFTGKRGDRIAQAVFARAPQIQFQIVTTLDDTARGEGGFGSTGIRA